MLRWIDGIQSDCNYQRVYHSQRGVPRKRGGEVGKTASITSLIAGKLSGGDRTNTNNHLEGWNNHICSATRNRQSGVCSKRCRPIPLRRRRKCFDMLWARCHRKRPRKLVRQHRSDCCDCATSISMAVVILKTLSAQLGTTSGYHVTDVSRLGLQDIKVAIPIQLLI